MAPLQAASRALQVGASLRPRLASSTSAFARRSPIQQPSSVLLRSAAFSTSRQMRATPADGAVEDPAAAEAIASYNTALEALQAGDFEKASEACTTAINSHGAGKVSPDLLFALGVIQQQGGNIPQAISTWERVLTLQERADVHTNLAASWMVHPEGRDISKAKGHIVKAQELDPLDKEITFNAAVIHEVCGDFEAAEHEYRKAKDLGVPQADQHIRNIGGKRLRQRLDEAEAEDKNKNDSDKS